MNRRTRARYISVIPVRFRWLDGWSEGTTANLNTRGCAITASARPSLARGSFLMIELRLASETKPMLVNPAVVRWVQGERFGIEFLSNRPVDEQRLAQFLETFSAAESGSK